MRKRSEAGFSALEIVIIVLIIGTLAAIAVPNFFSASRSYQLRVSAEALAQQLNRCRQEALRGNLPLRIQVVGTTTQIDTNRDGNFDGSDDPVFNFSDGPDVVALAPDDGIITFTSRGELPTGAQLPSVTLEYQGRQRIVSVDPRGSVTVGAETLAP